MKSFPSIPRLERADSELLDGGHLWIQEKVDGANIRFQLQDSGLLVFGDRSQEYDTEPMPAPYRHAVRFVREQFDRDALRGAIGDVESLVWFGEAMHQHAIDYDWETTPSFLGFDIWHARREQFLPPDVVEDAFRGVGLEVVPTYRKEQRATDFDPSEYEIPESHYVGGPAEGVIVRTKTGLRAKLLHPAFREVEETVPRDGTPRELARRYVTARRVEKIVQKLEDHDQTPTAELVSERVVEDVVREAHKQLFHADDPVDRQAFRSEVGARVRELYGSTDG